MLYWQHLHGYFQLISQSQLWKSLLSASSAGVRTKLHSVCTKASPCCTPVCVSRHTDFRESKNTRLDGTSGIIWSNFSWQKHSLDKVAQYSAQHHKSAQHWGNHHLPGEMIPMHFSHCEKMSLCAAGRSNLSSCLFHMTPCKKGAPTFFVATL